MAIITTDPSFRGYLSGLSQNGDPQATTALQYVGNDYNGSGTQGIDRPKLNEYNQSVTNDDNATQQSALDYLARVYQQYTGNSVLSDSTGTTNYTGGGSSGSVSAKAPAPDLSLYDANTTNLNDLLGRTQTGLDQGLQTNQAQYDQQVANANTDNAKQIQGQNTAKQAATDKINLNAGQGYNSLAQIIGRASGTGSSAFKDLLPNVVGKDTSSKMQDESNTYGQNLSNIDSSFQGVLQDLANQKKQQEDTLRSGVETQRQSLNQQLQQNAIARAQAAGQTPTQAVAGAQPFQNAINNSRNSVDSFFSQFQPTYTPESLNPDLQQYQTDRSQVNAQQQGAADPTNAYASLLRRKLQQT